jgi:hypothetical protein
MKINYVSKASAKIAVYLRFDLGKKWKGKVAHRYDAYPALKMGH